MVQLPDESAVIVPAEPSTLQTPGVSLLYFTGKRRPEPARVVRQAYALFG